MALFDFHPESKQMRLIGLGPGVTVDEVRDNTGFEILVADKLEQLEPPKADELKLLREEIDPDRVVIGNP